MSAVAAPLFTAERGGRRLRAFASDSSEPELPWFALGDLAAALATTREEEVELLAGLSSGDEFGLRLRDVVTSNGPTVLVDHPDAFLVLQLTGLLDEAPPTLAAASALFEVAIMGAMKAQARSSGRTPAEAITWARAAWARGAATMASNAERRRCSSELREQGHG